MAVGRPYLSPAAGGASFARRGVHLGRLHHDDPVAPCPGRRSRRPRRQEGREALQPRPAVGRR
eukprot:6777934-Lingulodinium_polyedra.AAC.1